MTTDATPRVSFQLDPRPAGGSIHRLLLTVGERHWPTALYLPAGSWDEAAQEQTNEFAGLPPDVTNAYLATIGPMAQALANEPTMEPIQRLLETYAPAGFRAITVLSVRRSLERLCVSLYRDGQTQSVSRNFNVTDFPHAGWDKQRRGFASASTNQRLDEHIERLLQFAWHTPEFSTDVLYNWEGRYVPLVAFKTMSFNRETDMVMLSRSGGMWVQTGLLVAKDTWNPLTEEVTQEYGGNSADKINAVLAKMRHDILELTQRKRT